MIFKEENRVRTINATLAEEERKCLLPAYLVLQRFEDALLDLNAEQIKLNGQRYSMDDIATARNFLYDLPNAAKSGTFKFDIIVDNHDDDEEDE